MAALIAQPARIPVVDPQTGLITREWSRYFSGLYLRVGGSNGLGTMDVDAGTFAAMQPAYFDAAPSDLIQPGDSGSACSSDVSQIDAASSYMCDIMQQG